MEVYQRVERILFWDICQEPLFSISMSKFTGTSEQQRLQELLRQIRVDAELKQADLAERLGQAQSFVSKYESGERRLDLLELREICEAVGISLATFVRRFERSINESQSSISKSRKVLLGNRAKH
jgi:ribosome-binding protein aMBF1 (putative translation factor)